MVVAAALMVPPIAMVVGVVAHRLRPGTPSPRGRCCHRPLRWRWWSGFLAGGFSARGMSAGGSCWQRPWPFSLDGRAGGVCRPRVWVGAGRWRGLGVVGEQGWIYQPALVLFFVPLPLTFPDGRLPSSRWRPVAVAAVTLVVVLLVLGAFGMPTLNLAAAELPNPYALDALADLASTGYLVAQLVTLAAGLVAVGSLFVRWRAAGRGTRRQILWVVLALGLVCGGFAVDAAVALLAPTLYPCFSRSFSYCRLSSRSPSPLRY